MATLGCDKHGVTCACDHSGSSPCDLILEYHTLYSVNGLLLATLPLVMFTKHLFTHDNFIACRMFPTTIGLRLVSTIGIGLCRVTWESWHSMAL